MSRFSDMRYRADTGFERRCESCAAKGGACFWPVTLEFWRPPSLKTCRACYLERQAGWRRVAYLRSEAYRAQQRQRVREYRAAVRGAQHVKDAERWERTRAELAARPELAAAYRKSRAEAQRRYRTRLREKAA